MEEIEVPRIINFGVSDRSKWSIHPFTDASMHAYSAVVFLCVEMDKGVGVRLLMAKFRVPPISNVSIPRLELLGCLIGDRLSNSVKIASQLPRCQASIAEVSGLNCRGVKP